MDHRIAVAACLAALAGCGGGSLAIEPGRWEVTATIFMVDQPLSPEAVPSVREQSERKTVCITPEQARRPYLDLLIPWAADGIRCSDNLTMEGGTVRATSNCTLLDGSGRTAGNFEGRYDTRSYTLQGQTEFYPQGEATGQGVTVRWSGRRLGECTGDEEAPPPRPS